MAQAERLVAGLRDLLGGGPYSDLDVIAVSHDRVHSKESAAAWALERLPREHRAVLERAVAVYRGEQQDRWDDVWPDEAYAHCVSAEIRASLHPLTRARLNERKT